MITSVLVVWASAVRAADEDLPPSTSGVDELTDADRRILERGEYSRGRIAASGIVGTFAGFGMGHLAQGRFGSRGWIFATVEGGSLTVFGIAGLVGINGGAGGGNLAAAGVALGGLGIFAIARLWEIGDVWAYPVVHNRRFRKSKEREPDPKVSFQVAPKVGGAMVGIAVRF